MEIRPELTKSSIRTSSLPASESAQAGTAKTRAENNLTLQFKSEGRKHVCFTGSDVLIDQIKKYSDEIPFETVVKKINRYYTLT